MDKLILCESYLAVKRYWESLSGCGILAKYDIKSHIITYVSGDRDYLFLNKSHPDSLLGGRWQAFEVLYPDEWQPSEELLELVKIPIRPKQEK